MPDRDKIVVSGDYIAGDKAVYADISSGNRGVEPLRAALSAWPELELLNDGGTYRREPISASPYLCTTTDMVCVTYDQNYNLLVRPVDEFERISGSSIVAPVIRQKRALECLGDASWVNFLGVQGQGKTWLLRQAAIKLSQLQLENLPTDAHSGCLHDGSPVIVPFFFDFYELFEKYTEAGNVFDAMLRIISSTRSNHTVYRQIFESTAPQIFLDNVDRFEDSSQEFELIRAIVAAIHSNAFGGVFSCSSNPLSGGQLSQICDFKEKIIAIPDDLQVARLLHFFDPEIKEHVKTRVTHLEQDVRTNIRFVKAVAKVFSLGDLDELIDAHRLTQKLLDFAEAASLGEKADVKRSTTEKILRMTWEASSSGGLSSKEAFRAISDELGEGSGDQEVSTLLTGLVNAGLLLQVSEGKFRLSDNHFARIAVAQRLVSDGGARGVIQDLPNDSDGELVLLATAIAECGHYDINLLCCVEFLKLYGEAIKDDPVSIRDETWLLFFTLISEVRRNINYRENDVEEFSVSEHAALSHILSESSAISLRSQVLKLARPVVQRPFDFVRIPSGLVDLGEEVEELYEIKDPFWILRYPISVYEFASFDEAGGSNNINPQLPATGVSWIEATKFCELHSTSLLSLAGLDTEEYQVRLPTEAEWKLAFRGGREIGGVDNLCPRRAYPWGDEPVANRANSPGLLVDGRIGLSPNGTWVGNVSPYGVCEMAGNCMEWCHTAWGGNDTETPKFGRPYDERDGREEYSPSDLRLALGGSWLFDDATVKCACRLVPDARHPDVGFRPVAVRRERSHD